MKSLLKIMLAVLLATWIVPAIMAADGNFTGYPDDLQIWKDKNELRVRDTGQIGFGDGTRTVPDVAVTYDTENDEVNFSKGISVDGGITSTGEINLGDGTGAITFNSGTYNTSNSDDDITNVGDIAVDSISADNTVVSIDSNWDAVGVTCSDLGAVTTADINAGTFDGVVGGTTPAAGDFTVIDVDQTPTANAYTDAILSTWEAGADMAAGGSNGIYAVAKPNEDVQNAYSLRGRMDMREAAEAVAVNQLHAVDALINFNETTDYTITDNISVVGAAVHGGTTSDIVDGYAGGVKPAGSVNLFFGVWGPTATQDLDCITNGVMIAAHEDTYLDYGYSLFNSGTSVAGLYILNHPTEEPATMTNGILIESEANRMTYGINLSGAGISTADIVFQEGETLDNATNGILNAVGDLQVRGATFYAGESASTGPDTYVLNPTPNMVVTAPTKGQMITWCADTDSTGASTISVDGVSDALKDRAGNATTGSDVVTGMMINMIFDGTNWRLTGI